MADIQGEGSFDDERTSGGAVSRPVPDMGVHDDDPGERTDILPVMDLSGISSASGNIDASSADEDPVPADVDAHDAASGARTPDEEGHGAPDHDDVSGDAAVESSARPSSPLDVPDFESLVAPVRLPRRRPPLPAVLGVVVAVIAVVALVATLAIVRPFGSVRASDYSEATKLTVTMQKQYEKTSSAIDDALGFLYSQDAAYDKTKAAKLKAQAKRMRASAASFADLKANKDETVSAAYDAYLRQATRFADLSSDLADSAESLSGMAQVCNDTPSGTMYDSDFTAQYEQYITSCRTSTASMAKAKAKVVSDFAGTLNQTLDQMTDVVNQMKAIGNASDFDSNSDQIRQLQSLSSQLVDMDASSGAINDFQDKLRQTRENSNPTTALQKLNDALQQGYDEQSSK
ncbi:hypothetical protein [Bifidobacterium platyrrhinorum]|uniref:Uncharacterized protein n=1 Tax=Bifidobacterium platyrrhinorum TaxID=2661628 RepID=A0A6L9SUS9_9BIFI|nr:hypothetical protein [Bifidobacterium platyrrhinorum]NEG56224.1 hypothetical protein [Bifidobacterium platyrrhinorum]